MHDRYLQAITERGVSCSQGSAELQQLQALSTSDTLSEEQCGVLKGALEAGVQKSMATSVLVRGVLLGCACFFDHVCVLPR